jgi:DNA helicase MCM8
LTAIVSPEKEGATLEAGALVLCDEGVCAIDEFDKVADSSALLEVAEQQTVSVAKAGIVCQLRARVSILASANPKSGLFEKNKSLKDNIKISNAILSRFDLIFLLIDVPNEKTDKVVSEHIVNVNTTIYSDEAWISKATFQPTIGVGSGSRKRRSGFVSCILC